jgi:hypothetical protein
MRSGSIPITLILLRLLFLFVFTYLFTLTANGFLPIGSGTTTRHNTQITHITQNNTQTKHVTQNYKNNEGQTTHNEYSANTITTTINKK